MIFSDIQKKILPIDFFLQLMDSENLDDIFEGYKKDRLDKRVIAFDPDYYNFRRHSINLYWIKKCVEAGKMILLHPETRIKCESEKYILMKHEVAAGPHINLIAHYIFDDIIVGISLGMGYCATSTFLCYVMTIKNPCIYLYNPGVTSEIVEPFYQFYLKNQSQEFHPELDGVITSYGYHNNLGHNLFNDCTGFYYLQDRMDGKFIDKVFMGPFDPYELKEKLENWTCKKVIEKKNLEEFCSAKGKGFIFKYAHFFISDSIVQSIYQDVEEINFPQYNKIFNIVLRCGSNRMKNQVKIISELIDKLEDKFPNSFFMLDGFSSDKNIFQDSIIGYVPNLKTYSEILSEYKNTSNKIISLTKTKNIISLIGLQYKKILSYLKKCNFCLYQFGSGCINAGFLAKIPGIEIGKMNIEMYRDIDMNILQTYPDIKYINNDKIKYIDNMYEISLDDLYSIIIENIDLCQKND